MKNCCTPSVQGGVQGVYSPFAHQRVLERTGVAKERGVDENCCTPSVQGGCTEGVQQFLHGKGSCLPRFFSRRICSSFFSLFFFQILRKNRESEDLDEELLVVAD